MIETPFFFDGNGYRLFGIIHDPEVKANGVDLFSATPLPRKSSGPTECL